MNNNDYSDNSVNAES